MIKIATFILGFALFFCCANQTLANFEFSSTNNSINDSDELTVNTGLDLSSSTANNTYYLRGAFFKEGTTDYFGYTINNNQTAYNGPFSECQNLFAVTVDSQGNWSGEIKVKADPADPAFNGTGTYLFKIGRYTTSCGSAIWADSSPITITITQTVFPTPTPSIQPTPQSTTSSSSTKKSPSPTPKASPQKSPSPTTKSSDQPTHQPQVLGISLQDSVSQMQNETPQSSSTAVPIQSTSLKFAPYLIGSGLSIIGFSILIFYYYKRSLESNKISKGPERFKQDEQDE